MSFPSSWAIAQYDGTDIEFRNVGFYTSDAGEIPKRTQATSFYSTGNLYKIVVTEKLL
jgi:hypothetical protein